MNTLLRERRIEDKAVWISDHKKLYTTAIVPSAVTLLYTLKMRGSTRFFKVL